MIKKIFILLLPVLALFFLPAQGQENWLYRYEQLSGAYYKPLKDSLKRKWDCPAVYKEKAIQKEYRNSWVSRADYLTNSLAENQYVKDSVLWPYLDGIMTQIVTANKSMISNPPLLLLDCSAVPNASAFGEHIITVNAGLVAASHTREELALYIAHELSHDILQHADNSMRKRAETISSDDYKESLKDVLSSKYQRYSRLMKIVDGYTFNRSRHSRYCEREADSLAVILLKKAQISFDASYFLNLDTVDETYRRNLAVPLKDYFSSYQLTIPDNLLQKKAKGLSSRNYNFKDTLGKDDSLKTHPDCKQRYETLKSFTDAAATHTAIPAAVQDQALQVSMWTIFLNRGLGHSFFRIFLLKDKQPASPWADFMFDNVLSSMLFSVSSLDRFHAIGIEKKEDVSKSYLELQTMLEQVTEDQLREWCNKRKQLNKATVAGADALAFRDFMNLLQQPVSEDVKKQVQVAAVEFRKTYANSPYLEYVNKITK